MRLKSLILFNIFYISLIGQITYIPDNAFEQKLLNLGFDSDLTINGQINTSDIDTIKELDLSLSNIYDFSGIEDFSSLQNLTISENWCDSIDVSNNLNLIAFYSSGCIYMQKVKLPNLIKIVSLSESPIEEINIQDLTQVEYIGLSHNRVAMQSIDLSNCIQLNYFNCINLGLQNIDLSNNINLTTLYCGNDPEVDWAPVAYNEFTNINLSHNVNLKDLMTINLPLKQLNLTYNNEIENVNSYFCDSLSEIVLNNNDKLKYLNINKCNLSDLDLNEILNIETLILGSFLDFFDDEYNTNHIKYLDFENNHSLKNLFVENISLESLNLRNNSNNILSNVNIKDNPNLGCVNVDHSSDANAGIGFYTDWLKSSYTGYSENCATVLINTPLISTIKIYPNPSSDYINIDNREKLIKKVELFTNIGEKIEINNSLYKTNSMIDISHLSKGDYFLILTDFDNNTYTKSVIIK